MMAEPERYLVVELVRGTTLRALLSRHRRLPAELTGAIGLEEFEDKKADLLARLPIE